MSNKTDKSPKNSNLSDNGAERSDTLSGSLIGLFVIMIAMGGVVIAITQFGINIPHISPIVKQFGITPPTKSEPFPSESSVEDSKEQTQATQSSDSDIENENAVKTESSQAVHDIDNKAAEFIESVEVLDNDNEAYDEEADIYNDNVNENGDEARSPFSQKETVIDASINDETIVDDHLEKENERLTDKPIQVDESFETVVDEIVKNDIDELRDQVASVKEVYPDADQIIEDLAEHVNEDSTGEQTKTDTHENSITTNTEAIETIDDQTSDENIPEIEEQADVVIQNGIVEDEVGETSSDEIVEALIETVPDEMVKTIVDDLPITAIDEKSDILDDQLVETEVDQISEPDVESPNEKVEETVSDKNSPDEIIDEDITTIEMHVGDAIKATKEEVTGDKEAEKIVEYASDETDGQVVDDTTVIITDKTVMTIADEKTDDATVKDDQESKDSDGTVDSATDKTNEQVDSATDKPISDETEGTLANETTDDATVEDIDEDIPVYLTADEKSNWHKIKASFDILNDNPSFAKDEFDNLNKILGGRSYISMYGSALALERISVLDVQEERNVIQAFRVLVNFGKKLPMQLMKPSLQIVVRLLIRSGRERMAVSTLEKYLPLLPDDQELKLLLVDTYLHNDDPDSAIRNAVQLDQESADVKVLIARAYEVQWEKTDDQEALASAVEALRSVKDKSAKVVIMLGELLERSDNTEEALEVYADGVSSGVLPSMLQRPITFTPGITAQAVWGGRKIPDISQGDKDTITKNIVNKGLFGEVAGGLTKEGVWGYYALAADGNWLAEECKAVSKLCTKLKEEGYGLVGQTYVSVLLPSSSTLAHTAPDNTHLHIIVPVSGTAHLRLAEFNITLSSDPVVIDPSFEKVFTNEGPDTAVFLIISIQHPDL